MGNRRLLAMRLEELGQDVAKVGRAVEMAANRHQLVQELNSYIGALGQHTVAKPLSKAKTAVEKLPEVLDSAAPEMLDVLEEYGIDLERAVLDLKEVQAGLLKAQRALHAAGAAVVLDRPTTEALKRNLTECESLRWKIKDLQDQLETGADVTALWAAFDELRGGRCETLFADYVDFLGGLTLRDNHLDERVGDLTDAFLAELGALRLAVPSRGPARASVLDVLMKLGFPEWTLWDVPMAAYEVAKAQESDSPVASRLLPLRLSGRPEEAEEVLFADAWAAYAVGPAYACSAVLLSLRPDRPADVDRAHVIFELLARIQPDGDFAVDVAEVQECWADAACELRGSARPDGAEALDRFVEEVHRRLSDTATACFNPARWEDAIGRLRPSFEPGSEAGVHTGPVLDLLNAAWSARLRQPAAAEDIERRVLASWAGPAQPTGRLGAGRTGYAPIREGRHGR
ncbi:MAG: hypothetical protein ACJ73S_05370 [Mycobacteriales bacterium]